MIRTESNQKRKYVQTVTQNDNTTSSDARYQSNEKLITSLFKLYKSNTRKETTTTTKANRYGEKQGVNLGPPFTTLTIVQSPSSQDERLCVNRECCKY